MSIVRDDAVITSTDDVGVSRPSNSKPVSNGPNAKFGLLKKIIHTWSSKYQKNGLNATSFVDVIVTLFLTVDTDI